ncbi:MAG TPA: helix-turn-helix transcriptional regulator [Flavobacterium sp.]|nr:helix-turn-helix transcriptional regulator [Flavobacterium sp.]
MDLNKLLFELINQEGTSTTEIASELKITEHRFSEWKSRNRNIKFSKLEEIADYLGYTIEIQFHKKSAN